MTSEFDVIARYFQGRGPVRDDVILGIGDDAALLQPPTGRQLVAAVDTLVVGRHFPAVNCISLTHFLFNKGMPAYRYHCFTACLFNLVDCIPYQPGIMYDLFTGMGLQDRF